MHGGDIYRNRVKWDYSVNVNPLPLPGAVLEALRKGIEHVGEYPDPECERLRKMIGDHFRLDAGRVLCGNGASELITAICRWRKPDTALLTAPGFSGYERALRASAAQVKYHALSPKDGFRVTGDLRERVLAERPDVLFLSNPLNPTGRIVDRLEMEKLAEACGRTGTTLVVDECFMELTDSPLEYSLTQCLHRFPGLLILRAFTKSFSIPGIRLGYLLGGAGTAMERIREQLPEWNVSVPAQYAGIAAVGEEKWLMKSREFIAGERLFLQEGLLRLGAEVIPSEANYLLFHWKDDLLYERLLERGFLIRDCRDYAGLGAGYFRIAVKGREENEELLKAMADLS